MQPSYIVCKICGYVIRWLKGFKLPEDDPETFQQALEYARQNVRCPSCGAKGKWMRKAHYKT